MYALAHEGEPPTGDFHPHTHAHAGRTPGDEADPRPSLLTPSVGLFVAVRGGAEYAAFVPGAAYP